jgi:hypothetical protein
VSSPAQSGNPDRVPAQSERLEDASRIRPELRSFAAIPRRAVWYAHQNPRGLLRDRLYWLIAEKSWGQNELHAVVKKSPGWEIARDFRLSDAAKLLHCSMPEVSRAAKDLKEEGRLDDVDRILRPSVNPKPIQKRPQEAASDREVKWNRSYDREFTRSTNFVADPIKAKQNLSKRFSNAPKEQISRARNTAARLTAGAGEIAAELARIENGQDLTSGGLEQVKAATLADSAQPDQVDRSVNSQRPCLTPTTSAPMPAKLFGDEATRLFGKLFKATCDLAIAAKVVEKLNHKDWRRFLAWAADKARSGNFKGYGILLTLAGQFVDSPTTAEVCSWVHDESYAVWVVPARVFWPRAFDPEWADGYTAWQELPTDDKATATRNLCARIDAGEKGKGEYGPLPRRFLESGQWRKGAREKTESVSEARDREEREFLLNAMKTKGS